MNRFVSTVKTAIFGSLSVAILCISMACGNNRSGLSISPVQQVRPNSTPGASCVTRGASAYVYEFAGHTHGNTEISAEDIIAANEKTYSTPITDGHWHGFVVTHDQFLDLQASVPVETKTYPDASGHIHNISIYCY